MVNRLLGLLGLKLVRSDSDAFTMEAALDRIARHRFDFGSVIDIGASNGSWSIRAMKHFPGAALLAIDPLSEREEALRKLQGKYADFRYALCAAGERNETVTLNVASDLDGSTVTGNGGNSRKVPSRTIDSLVAEHKLRPPYLLKFDTHGYELPILNGARETLKQTNVVVMEVYNFRITDTCLHFSEMCRYMDTLGFGVYDLVDPMLRKFDKSFWQMDLFFCRKDAEIFSCNHYQ